MEEIVLIAGMPASGKSTVVKEFVDAGYSRINRDTNGKSIDEQPEILKHHHSIGYRSFVLDNTYTTAQSRQSIIQMAKTLNLPIRCVWMNTSIEDCQVNACMRMMEKYGKILNPEEITKQKDANTFPIATLFAFNKKLEKPSVTEGFSNVETRVFKREWGPEYVNKGLILDFDDTLRTSKGPNLWPEHVDHVEILPGRTKVLNKWVDDGYQLFGASNQSPIAKGLKEEIAVACFEKTLELLGVEMEYKYCPHKIPPLTCYCRKPAVGMLVYFIHKYKLDVKKSYFVGDSTSDKTCATRVGMNYAHPDKFFK